VSDGAPDWLEAYVDGYRRVGGLLMSIRRRGERAKSYVKILVAASESLTSHAPSAIAAPSAEHAIRLGQIAGMASAVRVVIDQGSFNSNLTASAPFHDRLAERSALRAGELAPGLMAASDGEMRTLLWNGTVSELQAKEPVGNDPNNKWFIDPADKIQHAAQLLAELNASARRRSPEAHLARAEALDRQIAATPAHQQANRTAHAFAVHYLTKVYGQGDNGVRSAMLRFVATHPSHERATLQASKVAALFSDGPAHGARMALLDRIIILLGPGRGDSPISEAFARDSALVLLLLDDDVTEAGSSTGITTPVDSAHSPTTDGPEQSSSDASRARDLGTGVTDLISEISQQADRAIAAAAADRADRYERAMDAGLLTEAVAIVRDAVVDDDHDQAWMLLGDIARRHPEAEPAGLVTVAPNVLGAVSLDSEDYFDDPGAGCFTVLSPQPAKAAAAVTPVLERLLNVDDQGIEYADSEIPRTAGGYTPNYLHDLLWCDRGVQIILDTKGSMSAPMARGMLTIITGALIHNLVPAVVTGHIPALEPRMTPWKNED
jgi:hypothetical protein